MNAQSGRRRFGWAVFAALLGVHAGIHLIGAFKGFGVVSVPALTEPISPTLGILWLGAATLLGVGAVFVLVRPQGWWLYGGLGALISQVVIVTSWSDAAHGTILNALVLAAALYTHLTWGPRSFNAQYSRDIDQGRTDCAPSGLLVDADLAGLPPVVQRYIRRSGAVDHARVRNFSARFHGQIRSGPSSRWMTFTGQQSNFYAPLSRFFLMDASRAGVPVQAFHRFVSSSARMRVKVASAATVVDAEGPALDGAETVTLFNDLCVFAPGALADADIRWTESDHRTVEATFTHGPHTVTAALAFDDDGDLIDFTADGRGAMSADGKTLTPMRWSTPLNSYREFGTHRIMSRGEGIWHTPEGHYAYLRFILDSIDYNVAGPSKEARRVLLGSAAHTEPALGSTSRESI